MYLACWGHWERSKGLGANWRQMKLFDVPLPESGCAWLYLSWFCTLYPHRLTMTLFQTCLPTFDCSSFFAFTVVIQSCYPGRKSLPTSDSSCHLPNSTFPGAPGQSMHVKGPCKQFPSQGQLGIHMWIPVYALILRAEGYCTLLHILWVGLGIGTSILNDRNSKSGLIKIR